MTDLDNLLELQNALAASSRDRDRLRKYSAADYQRLAIIGRRIFVLCLSQVCQQLLNGLFMTYQDGPMRWARDVNSVESFVKPPFYRDQT
jgi:hypothetical protein